MASPVDLLTVRDAMVSMVDQMSTDLAAAITEVNANPGSTAAMFEMQYEVQRWSIGVSTQTNTVKALGDSLKSVTQNLR